MFEKSDAWKFAASLQAADGLMVSGHVQALAENWISGDARLGLLETALGAVSGMQTWDRQKEADVAAARIAKAVSACPSVACAPEELASIHAGIFEGILPDGWAGRWRKENLAKAERKLEGESVRYADWRDVPACLAYDFEKMRERMATEWDPTAFVRFVADVWQTHPFREGNTRAVATYSVLLSASSGKHVDLARFFNHGKEYRDALVVAAELGKFEPLGSFYAD